ncbi:MAG: 3-dehydroquinate synthase II [Euryarchaeota archaeon]
MELWIDLRESNTPQEAKPMGFERSIGGDVTVEGNKLIQAGTTIGAALHIEKGKNQDEARALIGSVSWLLVSFEDWSMIPLENLIAAAEGTPTQIAALLTKATQIQGAAFALERGVDAVVVSPDEALIEAAQISKAQRLERLDVTSIPTTPSSTNLQLCRLKITSVEEGGIGERYCVDFTSLLNIGEGMLIGSNASSFMLVHSETIPSEFVPVRPFRVNAGSPQSYVLMGDGSTKYLSELNSGDQVTVVNAHGATRNVVIGRLKIEQRPLLLFRWEYENDKEGHMFLQQAETVRAVDSTGTAISVTSLAIGDEILGWSDAGARHIGVTISSTVSER